MKNIHDLHEENLKTLNNLPIWSHIMIGIITWGTIIILIILANKEVIK